MNIYLIGFMGCGKTTLGKKLANKLNFNFIDLDHFIESKTGLLVKEIFEQQGEPRFREIEREALIEISFFENTVVATGGGAPCFFDNMEVINNQGLSVYLKLNPGVLCSRLITESQDRPLVRGKSRDELLEFITNTLQYREQFYNKAKLIIDAFKPVNELIEEVIKQTNIT